jgi:hypothetical protein
VVAAETLQLWLEYANSLQAELSSSDNRLSTTLQHSTCNQQPLSRDSIIVSAGNSAPQDAAPAFTAGLAFAELLRAKLDVTRANLKNVSSWLSKLDHQKKKLFPSLKSLQDNFKKIFDEFESNRSVMARQYLDVKKAKEVFSACELELKLASKGSISAATLSDKMLKMNAARDKFVDDHSFIEIIFRDILPQAPPGGR